MGNKRNPCPSIPQKPPWFALEWGNRTRFWGNCPIGPRTIPVENGHQIWRAGKLEHMTIRMWLCLLVAFGSFQSLRVRADDLFQLYWRGTYYVTNSTSHIIAVNFSEQTLVNQVAQNTGSDASQLVLVYRPRKRDVAVVQNNGAFVATVIQMQSTFTDVVNPTGSVIVRHALLTDQAHPTALGSFFGLELRTLNTSGGLVNDQLMGTALYANYDINAVLGAQVSTGGRIVDMTNAP